MSSQNTQDFNNLVDVYLDAVFRPKLTPFTLAQEGWHFDVADASAQPAFTGVVYNEMKGVYSSPDARLHYAQQAALFPDTEYAHNSGGDPVAIPSLTWDAFQAFHKTAYHPSNAKVFFCGDDPESERLTKLHAVFQGFQPAEALPPPAPQRRLPQPTATFGEYPAEEGAAHSDGLVSLAWVLDSGRRGADSPDRPRGAPLPLDSDTGHAVTSLYDSLRLQLLSELLLGERTSVLYKALQDSGLGTAVTGGGFDPSLAQGTFTVGLQGVSSDTLAASGLPTPPLDMPLHRLTRAGQTAEASADAQAAVAALQHVVRSTLSGVVQEGLEPERVAAALNTLEFRIREFASTGGSYAKGMALFLGVFGEWNAGQDPMPALQWESALARLKAACSDPQQVAAGFPELTVLVQQLLLDNTHCSAVHLAPSTSLPAAELAAESQAAAAALESLGHGAREAAAERQKALQERQRTPDSPEDIARIPVLGLQDLDPTAPHLPQEVSGLHGGSGASSLLRHDQATAGIAHTEVWCDLRQAPGHLLPLVPLLTSLMTGGGLSPTALTGAASELQLANRIGTSTGGISVRTDVGSIPGDSSGAVVAALHLRGKALAAQCGTMRDLLVDVGLHSTLDNPDVILHLLRESIAEKTSSVPQAGHSFASRFLHAPNSHEAALAEVWGGVTSLAWQRAVLAALTGKPQARTAPIVRTAVPGLGSDVPCIQLAPEAPCVPCPYIDAPNPHAAMQQLVGDLAALRTHAMTSGDVTGVVTADTATMAPATDCVLGVVGHLPPAGEADAHAATLASSSPEHLWGMKAASPLSARLLSVPTGVNYAVQTLRVQDIPQFAGPGKTLPGWVDVVASWLGKTYLWNNVRVQGGAYGAFLTPSAVSRQLSFASYRDPHLEATLGTYAGTSEWLLTHLPQGQEVTNAIVSTIGSIDAPMTPAARGRLAASRYVRQYTAADVQLRREEVLGTSTEHFQQFAEGIRAAATQAQVAAVTSPQMAQHERGAIASRGYAVSILAAT